MHLFVAQDVVVDGWVSAGIGSGRLASESLQEINSEFKAKDEYRHRVISGDSVG